MIGVVAAVRLAVIAVVQRVVVADADVFDSFSYWIAVQQTATSMDAGYRSTTRPNKISLEMLSFCD